MDDSQTTVSTTQPDIYDPDENEPPTVKHNDYHHHQHHHRQEQNTSQTVRSLRHLHYKPFSEHPPGG